ncbi:FAD-binding oxidoreductase [Kitasatospora azatica]|uniref:FAD-binding oxidoreductase n=1 Tax=Kitasatospora azatica TaxID=58347 RepID=UPI00056AEB46|nr:FAD-binding oxidoreductase [Kitasatospora azatica]
MGKPTIEDLTNRVHGGVITPSDEGYDEARRVYNGMVDRRPAAVVRCVNAGDVLAAVGFARENGLDLAVRGGGHSVPGYGTCEGGVVADLSGMRGVRVDPTSRTARVEGGATLSDLDAATHAFGLAVTGGIVSTTGVGGLTLGGGFGHLARSLGLTCDNLLSADVVTADGRLLVVSEREHPDLFWALRGGSGNFGAVTSFEYRLSPLENVYVGLFFYELEHVEAVLRHYREHIATAPEQLGAFPAFQIAPPLPFIPQDRHGDTFILEVVCWSGPLEEGEQAVQPFREAAPVSFELVTPMPYPALQGLFDALLPPGLQHYWKAAFATELTDGAIAAHAVHGPTVPVVTSTCHIYPVNGACHRVAPEATAFSYRDASFATVIAGMWPDPADDAANTAWVRDYYAAVAPHSSAGGYVNFMGPDDQDRVTDNYRDNYARLVDTKRAYDPENLFHVNHNIRP